MQDLSEYINSDLAQGFTQLNLCDQAVVPHSFSVPNPEEGGRSLIEPTSPLPALTESERQPSRTWQSSTVCSAEQSCTADSPTSLHEINLLDALSLRFRVVKARTKKSRLKIKKDLTPEEIGSVASGLITDESIPFFLNNYDYMCNVWVFFLSTRATTQSAADAIVVAFDVLYHIIGVGDARLLLRFAYVQLAEAVDFLVNAVSMEQRAGRVRPGCRDQSVYIDVYLTAKGKPLNNKKLRDELSGRKCIEMRFRQLMSVSPLLLAIYSDDAESIVYALLSTGATKLI
jgi:hypothetical protein